jgi:hypothetical protein
MTKRIALAAAVGLALAGCGQTCPTVDAPVKPGQPLGNACSAPAPAQVAITLELCEQCSHTDPVCDADLTYVGQARIDLDTRWDICTDNRSCVGEACAQVVCRFSVPAGQYQVRVLGPSGVRAFTLDVGDSSASCSGTT